MREEHDRLIGEASAFLEILEEVSQIAPLDKPVLVVGERGTGKELIAARIHYLSNRWERDYVKMNCAAVTETLLESELFGHEQGAFTGAAKLHKGRFERADKTSHGEDAVFYLYFAPSNDLASNCARGEPVGQIIFADHSFPQIRNLRNDRISGASLVGNIRNVDGHHLFFSRKFDFQLP